LRQEEFALNKQPQDTQPRPEPPIRQKVADEGNVPGRPYPVALLVIIAVMLVGLGLLYLTGQSGQ
jgi:hypothetical protein